MKSRFGKIALMMALVLNAGSAFAQSANAVGCVIAGPIDAPLTIEEYADFECPFCVRGSKTMNQVLKAYPGKIKLVYRNLPLVVHGSALVAAKAFSAVCIQSPSLAYVFQNEIFANQPEFIKKGESYLYEVARKIGVNLVQMKADMAGADVAKAIADDQQAAVSHSLTGTPSFVIGTEVVTGALPFREFKKIIDRQLGE